MEFLDISFVSWYSQSLLLADFKENHTLLWFKKSLQKKISETRKLVKSRKTENEGRKPEKISNLRRFLTRVYARKT
jgi:hypothetical protein